jgi:mRNA interferase MazF
MTTIGAKRTLLRTPMRGEIRWASFEPRSGSEERGRRPAVIVSHDGFNQVPTWRSVLVVPLSTSGTQARRGPTAVPIPDGTTGLARPSIALCHQVTVLDRAKLGQRIGVLPPDLLDAIETGLMHALDLRPRS